MTVTTSKTDLLRVIKDIERVNTHEMKAVVRADENYRKADEAMERFLQENKEYKRLDKALDRTRNKRRDIINEIILSRRMTVLELRTLIRTEGPTEAVVSKVKEAARKYLGVK